MNTMLLIRIATIAGCVLALYGIYRLIKEDTHSSKTITKQEQEKKKQSTSPLYGLNKTHVAILVFVVTIVAVVCLGLFTNLLGNVFQQHMLFYLMISLLFIVPPISYFGEKKLNNASQIPTPKEYARGVLGGYPLSGKDLDVKKTGPSPIRPLKTNLLGNVLGESKEGVASPFQVGGIPLAWAIGVMVAISLWILTNVESMFKVGIAYFGLTLVTMILLNAEAMHPKRTYASGAVAFGYGRWFTQILVGLFCAFTAISFNLVGLSFVQQQVLEIKNLPVISAILTAVFVPISEEGFFGNIITFSAAESLGWLPAVIARGLLFSAFHALTYSGLGAGAFVVAFTFGAVASFFNIKYKSMLPSLTGHIFINALAVI